MARINRYNLIKYQHVSTLGQMEFKASDGKWYSISEADMEHVNDAVTYWNETGRFYGPKSPEVRQFMLDPQNYYLEHYHINRSQGASLNQTYLPPAN